MRVVVVGKGGREHALAWKLKESSLLSDLWVCPGNPGMTLAGLRCAPVETAEEITEFCIKNNISLVVVGPESLILSDLKERLAQHDIPCFAPHPQVAKLESSKIFCKSILDAADIPTAKGAVAQNYEQALSVVNTHDFTQPIVVKADGLAQGKGVWVCSSKAHATEAVDALAEQFGYPLLFEECLIGQELSAFALCDGNDFVVLGTACDYKRITPDPYSANTGGMGAYSPCDFISAEDEKAIHNVFSKTLQTLSQKKLSYQGFLFAGLMKTSQGIYVLEFNVRMGDPETQALLPRLKSDLLSLIVAAVKHELKNQKCEVSTQTCVHVVAVSQGYPQAKMLLQRPISLPAMNTLKTQLYFSGVAKQAEDLVNSGGRVLGLTALAGTKAEAREVAYSDLKRTFFEGMYYREDIAE
ncbi:MAG: phosphoribosylamine--glycine ligase [Bdellovibrio sp.]|nr:phosphoribosylamine--glycine ligase [Bdellovibrio sp.]